ncbi:MAG: aspartate--tRNA ligase [archaeon]
MLRTHTCGELNKSYASEKATLCGWVETIRSAGKFSFLLLRDRYGTTQVFLNKNLTEKFAELNKESVVKVSGDVKARPINQINKEMVTGEIELSAESLEVLNECDSLPLDSSNATEDTRLKRRYLDLRSKRMQYNLVTRHKVVNSVNGFMNSRGFLAVETPFLAKSTPEGARDYLVPARNFPGKFFALPQSPQLFKQLLMIAGYDKYFQIVKCMRDEDLRSDRQPEFTQLDIEMSFIDEEDVYELCESLMKKVFKEVLDVDIKIPFQRMSYAEAMKKYKTDKPNLSKRKDDYQFLWVVDIPMFEYSETEKRYIASHHPFTSPVEEDLHLLDKTPEKANARAYDLVLNGFEIAGGSIRNHRVDIQKKIFKALKISDEEAEDKFGFLLNALSYGAPPHGGIAFGLDRLLAIMTAEESIRDVIAFPKNKEAKDLMLDAPSDVDKKQLDELGIKVK